MSKITLDCSNKNDYELITAFFIFGYCMLYIKVLPFFDLFEIGFVNDKVKQLMLALPASFTGHSHSNFFRGIRSICLLRSHSFY